MLDCCMITNNSLSDKIVDKLIQSELQRQRSQICLIPSENIASADIMKTQGSVFMNKYAEGYPTKRYYEGCEVCDDIEQLAIDRACKIFNVKYANVQPHSGSQANQAVFIACLQPGDTILGMDLGSGGHLTHGFKNNLSGTYYNAISYCVNARCATGAECTARVCATGAECINYDQVHTLALQHKPKMIIAGGSSYSRNIDWKKLRQIADEVNALLLADIAHLAGMIAGGALYNPCMEADIMTCTTHKTLRGPRGGLILTNNEELIKKINRAIMPGIQGGPMIHTIAAKAVCFGEAMSSDYKKYTQQMLLNAKIMCDIFQKRGLRIISGGTDSHLMVIDVSVLGKTGQEISALLAQHNIIVNKNAIPYDKLGVIKTSGIRVGSPCITTCDFNMEDTALLAEYVSDLILTGTSDRDISALFGKIEQKYEMLENEMKVSDR